MEIDNKGSKVSFLPDDRVRSVFGFNAVTLYEKHNLSFNPIDNLSFDNLFLETDIAQAMIFKGKRSGIIRNLTMDVPPVYK